MKNSVTNRDMDYSFIFDIGRVLVDFDFDRAIKRLEKFSSHGRKGLGEKIFSSNIDGRNLFCDYEIGDISSLEFYKGIKERTNLDMDYEDFAEIWSDIFTENVGISQFLESIKNHPKIIVSNICPLHWERLSEYSNINRFFKESEIIKSYEVRLRKPDLKIYEMAKKILPADMEIIYLDDSVEYVNAASGLGIRGIKYDCRDDDIDEIAKELIVLKR